jgi:mRNA-degrading endonuclease toxin of MazEF toxin-antitoxin module
MEKQALNSAEVGGESKAMADQIMTVSKERLTERLGLLSPNEMRGSVTVLVDASRVVS